MYLCKQDFAESPLKIDLIGSFVLLKMKSWHVKITRMLTNWDFIYFLLQAHYTCDLAKCQGSIMTIAETMHVKK
jgi:hypothetical protein